MQLELIIIVAVTNWALHTRFNVNKDTTPQMICSKTDFPRLSRCIFNDYSTLAYVMQRNPTTYYWTLMAHRTGDPTFEKTVVTGPSQTSMERSLSEQEGGRMLSNVSLSDWRVCMLSAVLTSPGFYTTEWEPPTLKLIYNPVQAILAVQRWSLLIILLIRILKKCSWVKCWGASKIQAAINSLSSDFCTVDTGLVQQIQSSTIATSKPPHSSILTYLRLIR